MRVQYCFSASLFHICGSTEFLAKYDGSGGVNVPCEQQADAVHAAF